MVDHHLVAFVKPGYHLPYCPNFRSPLSRVLQERIFQANAAGYELKQIDKQILAQEIRVNIANQEITNQ